MMGGCVGMVLHSTIHGRLSVEHSSTLRRRKGGAGSWNVDVPSHRGGGRLGVGRLVAVRRHGGREGGMWATNVGGHAERGGTAMGRVWLLSWVRVHVAVRRSTAAHHTPLLWAVVGSLRSSLPPSSPMTIQWSSTHLIGWQLLLLLFVPSSSTTSSRPALVVRCVRRRP